MKGFITKNTLIFLFALISLSCLSRMAMAADFLDPEQAFKIRAELNASGAVELKWEIAKGYKLYRNQITASVGSGSARIGAPVLPAGETYTDPTTNEKQEVYHDRLTVKVPVEKADGPFTLDIAYQGCAEDGLCYPPITRSFKVDPKHPGVLALADAANGGGGSDTVTKGGAASASAQAVQQGGKTDGNEMNLAKATLEGGSLWKIGLAFLVFGLLLSFTPCVLPMVPILSSIIVGEGSVTRSRSFLMAVAYCLGMALVYTSLGVAAGLAGEGLAGALQKPWVLVLFALLLVLLALSMFDVYQLQMPASIQGSLTKTSGRLKGGRFTGVFIMGALSALIVGPCVAAPLAGTLVYISQTKDVVIGGLALFSMALGMSVPLLLIGLSAGSLLPKAGTWMIGVKYVFGLMLIAVAIWMVNPVFPPQVLMAAWGSFAILCAVFLGFFDAAPAKATIAWRFKKTLGLVVLVIGAVEFVGAASGATNILEPLSCVKAASSDASREEGKVRFTRIGSVAELDRALQSAKKPVMLDFYADWCVSCKETEKFTFGDPKVRERLDTLTLLQVDVTGNTEADRALMKRFGVFGPPAMIFFDRSGKEIQGSRIIGFIEAASFLEQTGRFLMN